MRFSATRAYVINSSGDAGDDNPGDGIPGTGETVLRDGVPEPEVTLRSLLEECDSARLPGPPVPHVLFDTVDGSPVQPLSLIHISEPTRPY